MPYKIFSYLLNWKYISGMTFEDVKDIAKNTVVQLRIISKEKFQKYFNQWKTHWNKCVTLRRSVLYLIYILEIEK